VERTISFWNNNYTKYPKTSSCLSDRN